MATKKLDVRLPVEMREAVDELVVERRSEGESEKFGASDIVREALAHYFTNLGKPVPADVQWGGDRRSSRQPEVVPA